MGGLKIEGQNWHVGFMQWCQGLTSHEIPVELRGQRRAAFRVRTASQNPRPR